MLTRVRKTIYRARGWVPLTLRDETFRGDPYHSKFWRKASAGAWEPHTFKVLADHLDADHDYLDVGAWIGPTVIYAARKARHVWAFEPDPTAFRHLAWNVELNDLTNVSALPVAISETVGVARMASFGGEAGDSMSSLLNTDGLGSDVVTLGWDDVVRAVDLSRVSLVKMDIEGAEFDVIPLMLPWLKAQRPALFLSTHAPYLPEAERRERMAALAAALDFYPFWTDDAGAATTPAALTAPRALDTFPTVLLTG